jgi:protein SCO1/2
MKPGVAVLLLMLAAAALPADALTPQQVARIEAAPAAGAALPAEARFRDEHERAVRLGDYFAARPAIVILGYYGCSNLCSLVLDGVARGLAQAGLRAGRDAEIVVISIAPQETPAMALAKKRAVLGTAAADAGGWHFLTGDDAAIGALTHATGYTYAYDTGEQQYAHPAGILVVAPGGRLRARLPGIAYPATTLRAALTADEADPAPASPWLLCFHYDPHSGRYTFAAMAAVRLAALSVLAVLAGYVVRARWRETRHAGAPRRGTP